MQTRRPNDVHVKGVHCWESKFRARNRAVLVTLEWHFSNDGKQFNYKGLYRSLRTGKMQKGRQCYRLSGNGNISGAFYVP